MQKYILIGTKVLLTLAFVAAGSFKLIGHEMMVATFEAVGVGQWFRYVTGIIELGGALLLWLPGRQFIGAALLGGTMVGATLSHLTVVPGSAAPAVVLGLLAVYVLYRHRDQNPIG